MLKLTDQDAETKSADLIEGNIEQLKGLFPEAFTEGKIDFDILRQLLGDAIEEREEKYGLNWHGKRRARQIALTPSTGTLRPCPEDSVDWDTTQNLMIEGDNLEVLKLLQKSYAGKVKLIYIDPPYNTGKDFVYPDDFRDNIKNYLELTGQIEGSKKISSNTEASGRFHTDWLNFIYPRIKLSYSLLKNEGVILISISDKEASNLRQICNELFGEENFVGCMVWEKGRKNDAKLLSIGHEYVLIYAKSYTHLTANGTIWREEKPGAREIWTKYVELRRDYGNDDRKIETKLQEWFSSLPKTHPSRKWIRYRRVDANGPWRDDNISWPGGDGPTYDVIHPKTGKPCKVPERGWVYADSDTMHSKIKAGVVEFREDHTEPPIRKSHLRPISEEGLDDDAISVFDEATENDEDELATQVRGSYFYKQSQVTIKYMRHLMGQKIFDNPKDHYEIARLIKYCCADDEKALVVDFFAGSGTTGHSVWQLNSEDDGQRRFILVQLPEPLYESKKEQKASAKFLANMGLNTNLAELTKERLRRAGKKIKDENPIFKGDLGFRVFKLDSSNIHAWEPDRDDLGQSLFGAAEHLKTDRTEQDILFELLLKLGLDLTIPIEQKAIAGKTTHSIGAGVLMVCLAPQISHEEVEPLALGLVEWHKQLAPAGDTQLVFRDSAFADDVAKTNLTAILQQHGLENVRSL